MPFIKVHTENDKWFDPFLIINTKYIVSMENVSFSTDNSLHHKMVFKGTGLIMDSMYTKETPDEIWAMIQEAENK